MLHTALTDKLGIRVPIINAPMTPQAGGALAVAVSQAGGFGMLGIDEDETIDDISAQLNIIRSAGEAPFGMGLVAWVVAKRPELIDLVLAARPRMVSLSFGDPTAYIGRFREAGILVASQVQNRKSALVALEAGVDILVAQGAEAGGHTGTVGTLPLLQLLLEMTDKPIVAAGGIVSGRGLAAVLAAGAAAAWIGTPFLLAKESRTPQGARDAVIESDETIYTSVYDKLQGKGWTSEIRGRAINNAFAERWTGREDELMRTPAAIAQFNAAKKARDYATLNVYAGQSIGMLDRMCAAADVVERYEREAIERVDACASLLRERRA
jgi:nitronate monooxygenase